MKFPATLLVLLPLCASPAFAEETSNPPPRCISAQDIGSFEAYAKSVKPDDSSSSQ